MSGNSTGTGSGVDLSGNVTGGSVTGNASGTGSGVSVSGSDSTATNTSISGNTSNGTGVSISGNLTNTGSTTVSGNATGSGSGVHLNNGTVTGGLVQGDAHDGAGIKVSGNSTINHATVNGTTTNGSGFLVDGTLSQSPDSIVNGAVKPGGTGEAVTKVTPPAEQDRAQMMSQVSRQQQVTSEMGREAIRPQAGYQPAPAPVEMQLCDGDSCQSLTLDAHKASPSSPLSTSVTSPVNRP
ncbi:TPA_asm: hypothetical protein G0G79_28910 [Salmonella enterica]|nr:hypothetical protein [Salmonella enterica]